MKGHRTWAKVYLAELAVWQALNLNQQFNSDLSISGRKRPF